MINFINKVIISRIYLKFCNMLTLQKLIVLCKVTITYKGCLLIYVSILNMKKKKCEINFEFLKPHIFYLQKISKTIKSVDYCKMNNNLRHLSRFLLV